MHIEKPSEKQIGARDRRFIVWSKADALVTRTGKTFEDVLPEAMVGMKLSGTDLRGVLDLEKVNHDIRQAILNAPSSTLKSAESNAAPDDVFTVFAQLEEPPANSPGEDVAETIEDRETRLLAARERVIMHLDKLRVLPFHAVPYPKLGVTFFMVGKITIDGDDREWNHNGKHAKFKALIPDCETKIIPLNGETFPKPFFFEDWAWNVPSSDKKVLCSGNLKVFCLKHEPGTEYICWVNPGGKGDPWRFKYKMTATGLELTRFKLKPDSREDYVRIDPSPITIRQPAD